MKPLLKKGFAVFCTITAISCTKENIKNSPSIVTQSRDKSLSFTIGQHYGGGIIFYIDTSGKHGLIADTGDLTINSARWWNPEIETLSHTRTKAFATKIGSGLANTKKIIATEGDSGHY